MIFLVQFAINLSTRNFFSKTTNALVQPVCEFSFWVFEKFTYKCPIYSKLHLKPFDYPYINLKVILKLHKPLGESNLNELSNTASSDFL